MEVVDMIRVVKRFFAEVLGVKCRVLTMQRNGEDWKAICEVQVNEEYTRKKGLGDIVEIYETSISQAGEVTGYELKATKPRAAID